MPQLKLTSETLSVEIEEILMADTSVYYNKVQNGKKIHCQYYNHKRCNVCSINVKVNK